MKKLLAMAVAASALAFAAPATAQGWQSINQRQAQLDQRIDVGVRNGSLTRNEAVRLRSEFGDLARLEARYRAGDGLSYGERQDLDRRFDALSQRIRYERNDRDDRGDWRNDRDGRGWISINDRQRRLDARIDAGIRDGSLSRREAVRLRGEFRTIAAIEQDYRRNGLSYRERQDLDRRFDRLSAQIEAQRNDYNNRRRG
ncbi:hypothetical protein U91I_00139 [alpha proteobacterium U9-1i]|nr:hypothetical protein U91I_00139 [alpha proteobacterium U9-1i]